MFAKLIKYFLETALFLSQIDEYFSLNDVLTFYSKECNQKYRFVPMHVVHIYVFMNGNLGKVYTCWAVYI